MNRKQKIYNHYLQLVNEKIQQLQQVLDDLKAIGANETKSTAGDKHETALAMLQIEQSHKREQLNAVQAQKAVMEKINPAIVATVVVNGSLINTNRGYLWMSCALGRAVIDDLQVTALSPQSPLGNQLMGKRAGEAVKVNGNSYVIDTIE